MADIFKNPYSGGVTTWSAQTATIAFGGVKDLHKIIGAIQGIQITYGRQISNRYPVGGNTAIRMVGAPSGTIRLHCIFGPQATIVNFLDAFSKTCKPLDLTITPNNNNNNNIQPECQNGGVKITCKGCTGIQLEYRHQGSQDGMTIAQGTFVLSFNQMTMGNKKG